MLKCYTLVLSNNGVNQVFNWTFFIVLTFHLILFRSALAAWSVAILVLAFIVSRGAIFLLLSGSLMVGACGLYHGLHPGTSLTIPFEDSYMEFRYGWSFWMCAIFGEELNLLKLMSVWMIDIHDICVSKWQGAKQL